MQINDLVQIVLDPSLGTMWPPQAGFELDWYPGRKWRVEYVFSSPAVPVAALTVGNELRGIWRYEVVAHGEWGPEKKPSVTVRISPERQGFDGYHFVATYERPSLRLLSAERFEGTMKLPFERRPLPPLKQAVAMAPDGRGFTRFFSMPEPQDEVGLPDDGAAAGGGPDGGVGAFPGEKELFAGAEPIDES